MMPENIEGINGKNICSSDIFIDQKVVNELRKF